MEVFIFFLLVAAASAQSNLCAGKQPGFYPDLYDCQWYFYCDVNGVAERHSCPSNQWYDRTTEACNYKEQVECTPIAPPEEQPKCPANGTESVPIIGDCNRYYLCVNGEQFEMSCGPGTEFDTDALVCRDEKTSICNKCPVVDVPGILVFLPNKTDCTKYVLCRKREQIEMTCDEGLHYNERDNYCEAPLLAKCRYAF